MTNGDKIRQMSNEELVEGMLNLDFCYCDFCLYECSSRECLENTCKDSIKAYLDMEAE
jgi:hypothetical protein